jgi:hypothetical protein
MQVLDRFRSTQTRVTQVIPATQTRDKTRDTGDTREMIRKTISEHDLWFSA